LGHTAEFGVATLSLVSSVCDGSRPELLSGGAALCFVFIRPSVLSLTIQSALISFKISLQVSKFQKVKNSTVCLKNVRAIQFFFYYTRQHLNNSGT
jgi:hypothetical protein